MKQKKWPAAIDDFGTAVSYAKQIGFWRGMTEGGPLLAQAYEGAGQLLKALASINEAIEANKHVPGENYFLPGNLAIKARIQSKLRQIAEAESSYKKGQFVALAMLRTARTRNIERTLLAQLSDLYAGNFALLCDMQRFTQAFYVIETARGRLEAESLQEPRHPQSPDLPTIAEQQVTTWLFSLIDTDSPGLEQHLLEEITNTQKNLDSYSPPPYITVKPSDLSKVQSSLRAKELLIEYVLYTPSSYVLAITNTSIHAYTLPDKRVFDGQASSYRDKMQSRKADKKAAHSLFENLLKPIPEYADAASIVVVPDGSLHLLPFSALIDDSGSYLIQSHEISVTPSGTVFEILQHRNGRTAVASIPFLGIAPFAEKGSDIKSWVLKAKSSTRNRPTLLPESRSEVEYIAAMFPKPTLPITPVLIGPDATKSKFRKQPVSECKVLHFSTHAYVDPNFPDRSAIQLAPEHSGDGDSSLQIWEIRQLKLNADLVTLSACNTGIGPTDDVGIINIVDSFIEAGAQTVVSTSWDVDDNSTATLMKSFYRHLSNGQGKEEALRRAQIELLNTGAFPYYWASFSIVGDPHGTLYRIPNASHSF
jgi:CHAT domain-containing protein